MSPEIHVFHMCQITGNKGHEVGNSPAMAAAVGSLPVSLRSCDFGLLLYKRQLPVSASICPGVSEALENCHAHPQQVSGPTELTPPP